MMRNQTEKQVNGCAFRSLQPTSRRYEYISPSIQESNPYFPTLQPKRYNILTLKKLMAHQRQEKARHFFRKTMKLPTNYQKQNQCPIQYHWQKAHKVHPLFQKTLNLNRRIHEFLNTKKKKMSPQYFKDQMDPICLTEPQEPFEPEKNSSQGL